MVDMHQGSACNIDRKIRYTINMLHLHVFQYICYSLDIQFSGQKNGVFQILKYIPFMKYVQ